MNTEPGPVLAVVVPLHEEEASVVPLVAEIVGALNGMAFEVVAVDDGSRDATSARLAEAAARWPMLRVVTHRVRRGQSAALLTGVRASRAPFVATLDGDGQNDPADIPRLFARAGAGTLVAGVRRHRDDPMAKRLASRIANATRRAVLRDGAADTGCGLKVFPRAAFLALPAFDHMHRFLPALFLAAGHRVVYHDVAHRPRRAGRTKYGIGDRLWTGIADLGGVAWLRRRMILPPHEGGDGHDG